MRVSRYVFHMTGGETVEVDIPTEKFYDFFGENGRRWIHIGLGDRILILNSYNILYIEDIEKRDEGEREAI